MVYVFFHEAGHILLHGKKELFLEGANGINEEREAEANVVAGDNMIPPGAWKPFVGQADFSLQAIQDFAEHIEIAPGIVVGRLQHDGHLPHAHGNRPKISFHWK